MCAKQHTHSVVTKGQKVAGTRAIPLLIDPTIITQAVQIAKECRGILRVLPMKKTNVGVLLQAKRNKNNFFPPI